MFTWEVSKEFRFPASYLTLMWYSKSLEIATHPYKGIELSKRKAQQLLDFSEKTSDSENHSQSSWGGQRIWTVTLMQQDLQEPGVCMEILINWWVAGGSAQSKLRKARGGSNQHENSHRLWGVLPIEIHKPSYWRSYPLPFWQGRGLKRGDTCHARADHLTRCAYRRNLLNRI